MPYQNPWLYGDNARWEVPCRSACCDIHTSSTATHESSLLERIASSGSRMPLSDAMKAKHDEAVGLLAQNESSFTKAIDAEHERTRLRSL